MSLSLKFSLFIISIVFAILSTITVVLIVMRTQQLGQELTEKDKISSVLLARELSDSFADYYFYQYDTYRDFVRSKLSQYGDILHFTMYSTSGEILFDSSQLEDPPGSRPIATHKVEDPAILDAIALQKQQVAMTPFRNAQSIHILQPFVDKFDVYRNMFEIHYSTQDIQDSIKQTIIFYTIFLVLFTIVSLGVTLLLAHQITKPLNTLTNAAINFSSGKLDYSVEINSKDEIGTLAKAFKRMSNDLQISHQKLEMQNRDLEVEVTKRTQELQDKVEEMERLQKLTVDRELKMIEMKRKLEELQEKK